MTSVDSDAVLALAGAGQALLNILEDAAAEKVRSQDGQKALLNILDDAALERHGLDQAHLAMLNLLEDSAAERDSVQDGQNALLNILDDLAVERSRVETVNLELGHEIDEHRLAEQALRESTDELARSNSDLEMFAYAASHDLSEPLRAISGPISLLAKRYGGALDSEADQLIEFAVDGCQRMQALINDLLTYSRVGRFDTDVRTVDCAAIAEEVVLTLSTVIADSGATVEIAPGLPLVRANATGVRHVLQNLLSNAIKFSANANKPYVRVEAERAAEAWRITVTDNGIGISPEHRTRIFGLFKRLHTRDTYPGTGVGLALVKKIIEQHRGLIGVDDAACGSGSVFWFTLPAAEEASP